MTRIGPAVCFGKSTQRGGVHARKKGGVTALQSSHSPMTFTLDADQAKLFSSLVLGSALPSQAKLTSFPRLGAAIGQIDVSYTSGVRSLSSDDAVE